MEKIYFSPKTFLCFVSTLLLLVGLNSGLFGQGAPEGINYQAIARTSTGSPVGDTIPIAIKFSIYPDTLGSPAMFSEIHNPVYTNMYGLFTLIIGSANPADFKTIPWGSGDKYLQVEIAQVSDMIYLPMGMNRLVSVPYALFAKKTGNAWELDGNTLPPSDTAMFIGTVNNKDFVIKTDSIQRVRITAGGNMGIGTGTPTAKLDVMGQIKITDGTEGAGRVLTSDANGLASWMAPSGGAVTSFSADSLQPLFTTTVTNDSTTPALSFTLVNAPALSVFGNDSILGAAPTYFKPELNSALFENQGSNTTVLHGNASGNPSWGPVNLTTTVTGILPLANGGTGPVGTAGQILTASGTGPVWASPAANTSSQAGVVSMGSGNPDKVWKTDASGNPGWRTDSSNVAQPWTLSGSTVFNNNTGNVGIGTTTPTSKLHVLNTSVSDNAGVFEINNSTNTSAALKSITNGGGQAGNFSITNSTSSADAVVVTTNGQNSKALYVTHTGTGNAVDYGAFISSTGGTGGENRGGHFEAAGTANKNIGGYFTADGGTNNYAAIFEKGSVGIGTTNPISPLNIVYNFPGLTSGLVLNNSNATNTAFTSILLVNNIGYSGGISLNSSTNPTSSGFSGMNVGTNSPTKLQLGTNNLPRVTIDSIGRVGIGTAALAPTQLLEVKDGNLLLSNSGTASRLMFAEPGGSGSNKTSFRAGIQSADIDYTLPTAYPSSNNQVLSSTTTGTLSWASAASLGAWTLTGNASTNPATNFIGTTDAVDLVFKTTSLERMRVTSSGNLAIGTATPTTQVRLHVFENAPYSSQVKIENSNASSTSGSQLSFYNNTGNSNYAFMLFGSSANTSYAGRNSLTLGTIGTGKMQFWTNNTSRVTVDSIGNVGIGSNTPNLYGYANNGGLLTVQNPVGTTYHGVLELANQTDGNEIIIGEIGFSGATQTNANSKISALIQGLLSGPTANNRGSALRFYTRPDGFGKDVIERMRIDTAGNVGIGTAVPSYKLDVRGTKLKNQTAFENLLQIASTDAISPLALRLGIKTDATVANRYAAIEVDDGGTKRNLVLAPGVSGNVGIGTTTPSSKLDVNGNATISGNLGINCTSPQYLLHVNGDAGFNGTVYGTSVSLALGVNTCSDLRYKKEITLIPNALNNLLKLNGVNYYWRIDEFPKKAFNKEKQIGFIAQDLEKIYPEVVFTDKDGFKSVDYSRLTPILVEAIKEQQQTIDAMQKKNEENNKKQFELIEAMQKEIEALKKK